MEPAPNVWYRKSKNRSNWENLRKRDHPAKMHHYYKPATRENPLEDQAQGGAASISNEKTPRHRAPSITFILTLYLSFFFLIQTEL